MFWYQGAGKVSRLLLTFLRRLLCSSLLKNFFSLKRSLRKSTWQSRRQWWWKIGLSPPLDCRNHSIGRFSPGQTFSGSPCTWVRVFLKICGNIIWKDFQPCFRIEGELFECLDEISIRGLVQNWPAMKVMMKVLLQDDGNKTVQQWWTVVICSC